MTAEFVPYSAEALKDFTPGQIRAVYMDLIKERNYALAELNRVQQDLDKVAGVILDRNISLWAT